MLVFKTVMIYGLVRVFGGDHPTATKTGLLLSQGGEFGFVLYTAAERRGLISAEDFEPADRGGDDFDGHHAVPDPLRAAAPRSGASRRPP